MRLAKYIIPVVMLLFFSGVVFAQGETEDTQFKAVVVEVLESRQDAAGFVYQQLKVRLDDDTALVIENDTSVSGKKVEYQKGDRVVVQKAYESAEGTAVFVIVDYQRTSYLYFIFALFVVLALVVGRKYGLYSLIGMLVSFAVIFKFILPQIILGRNPVFVTTLASVFIIPITFYLSHGFNKKTHVAIVSTVITLVGTVLLTAISVSAAKLTGYSTEEAMFLQVSNGDINMRGILLAGIIIGFLGVLDDVTVSQSSVVMQLRASNRDFGTMELYKKAMVVGRDHITSMINTLVLVYTGASMPLLLLFLNNPGTFNSIINMELVADEIVRTLIGSIGLILAVPLSTFFAALVSEGE